MIELKLVQNLVIWLGSIIVISSITLYVLDNPKKAGRKTWSPHDIWVLLILEMVSFGSVAVVVSLLKKPEELADYLAFSAPCVAAIIVGIGLVKRATKLTDKSLKKCCCCQDESSEVMGDFKSYLWSSGVLFGALIAYLAAKFDPKVFGWSICLFSACCLFAYVASFNKSDDTRWRYRGNTPQVLIGCLSLMLLIIILMWVAGNG
ncbi:hypothetical protein [Dyella sp. C9]|uniref:hypothetical protein n=1 Tax=Dyella sp. C9 TaxID=2202154 RepID=UPI0013001C9E|nr:hypothetical protein [Dyella sp. C9]